MKKLLVFITLFFILCSLAFSQTESGISIGYSHAFFFDSYADNGTIKSYIESPGIAFHSFSFWDKKTVGLFAHAFLIGFPESVTIEKNGIEKKTDFDWGGQTGLVIGPAFRHYFNEKLILQYGAGFNFYMTAAEYSEYIPALAKTVLFERGDYTFGIGGDISLRFKITKYLILNIGSVFTFNFANYIEIYSTAPSLETQGWAKDYFQFSVRPYISIGANLYW
ncbi:MAG: hypothetical protein LBU88_08505 [Treponema sp.]|jgi:hypothetical protein|nr:hypothetical protein [Treponema sp.]